MIPTETPAALGFRMPAEWEPHEATWLSWPHSPGTWPRELAAAGQAWAALARTLAAHERVRIAAAPHLHDRVRRCLDGAANISVEDIPTDDAWMRDHGATFLTNPETDELAAIDWRFNAWGGKYPPWDADDRVARAMAELASCRCFSSDFVAEGGALEVNGLGTLLATADCLVDQRRNPGCRQTSVEQLLRDYLGVRNIVWLAGEIAGDDTDGHVDQVARFVNPTTVLCAVESNPHDVNHEPLEANLRRLRAAHDQDGAPFEVVPLPMPRPVFDDDYRLPASYANFYVANGIVVVPAFGDPLDEVARQIVSEWFPDRETVSLDAYHIVRGFGALHCITQQQPAGRAMSP